jgi:hypothetical protein
VVTRLVSPNVAHIWVFASSPFAWSLPAHYQPTNLYPLFSETLFSRTTHENRNRPRPIKIGSIGFPGCPCFNTCHQWRQACCKVGDIKLRSSYSVLIRCRAAAAGRGRRPRGRGGARKAERPAKSAADLDAEMEVRANTPNTYLPCSYDSSFRSGLHRRQCTRHRCCCLDVLSFFFRTVVVVYCTSFFGLCRLSPQFLKA